MLVLYSDGVTEAQNAAGDQFGEQRLGSLVEECAGLPARGVAECVRDGVRRFRGGSRASDDLSVLVIRRRG